MICIEQLMEVAYWMPQISEVNLLLWWMPEVCLQSDWQFSESACNFMFFRHEFSTSWRTAMVSWWRCLSSFSLATVSLWCGPYDLYWVAQTFPAYIFYHQLLKSLSYDLYLSPWHGSLQSLSTTLTSLGQGFIGSTTPLLRSSSSAMTQSQAHP